MSKTMAVLVHKITSSASHTQGYRFPYFCRINGAYKSEDCICVALTKKCMPFGVGDLIILEYWHTDVGKEEIWRVVDD